VIEIKADNGVQLEWVRVDEPSDGAAALITLAAQQDLTDAPVVPLESLVSITFQGEQPASVELTDQIIGTDGTPRYDVPLEVITLSEQDGSFSFRLPFNFAALLSSYSGDYALGAVIRGFTFKVNSGTAEVTYAFALRTEAGGGPFPVEP